jgi:hypothetical protein
VDVGGSPDDTIVVAGSARSGTTWVGDVVAQATNSRIVFEPFLIDRHGDFVLSRTRRLPARVLRNYQLHIPASAGPQERHFAQMDRILRGQVGSFWSEMQARPGVFRHRVVKEVRANLFLGYLATNWPAIRILLVLRDPYQVIASQLAKIREGWKFDWNKEDVLSQEALMHEWLAPFESTIVGAVGLVERLANKWCIETYVAQEELRGRNSALVISYAEFAGESASWTRVAEFLGAFDWSAGACQAAVAVPSYTARRPSFRGHGSPSPRSLDGNTLSAIAHIVDEYGLTDLVRQLVGPCDRTARLLPP